MLLLTRPLSSRIDDGIRTDAFLGAPPSRRLGGGRNVSRRGSRPRFCACGQKLTQLLGTHWSLTARSSRKKGYSPRSAASPVLAEMETSPSVCVEAATDATSRAVSVVECSVFWLCPLRVVRTGARRLHRRVCCCFSRHAVINMKGRHLMGVFIYRTKDCTLLSQITLLFFGSPIQYIWLLQALCTDRWQLLR